MGGRGGGVGGCFFFNETATTEIYNLSLHDALPIFPRSTLFVLVCTVCGIDLAKSAYAEAIARRYRFYSYGDAMLIL